MGGWTCPRPALAATLADFLTGGAFLAGFALGSLVTVRITRWILGYLRSEADERRGP